MTQLMVDVCPWAASVLFNLPDNHVTELNRGADGHRHEAITPEGTVHRLRRIQHRVHQRTRQRHAVLAAQSQSVG